MLFSAFYIMVSATQALAVAIAATLAVTYSGKGGYVVKSVASILLHTYTPNAFTIQFILSTQIHVIVEALPPHPSLQTVLTRALRELIISLKIQHQLLLSIH